MRKEHLQSKRASSSPGLMVLAGAPDTGPWQHGSMARQDGQRGWPCPRKDLKSLSLASGLVPLAWVPAAVGTQVPPHPNNVQPLARSGQCLASPAQSPAGPPPRSPQAPLNFGRVWSTGLGTLAAGLSPPPPRVEVKYRGPGMGRSKARARSPFPTRCRCASGNPASQSPASPVSVPVLRRPKIQPKAQSSSAPVPSFQSTSLPPARARRKAGRRASEGASKQAVACVCARVCVLVCVPPCLP